MNAILTEIGQRLSARRKQLGMTQEKLAEQANVTAQTISYAELGKKAMRADTIVGICDALHISSDYLLFGGVTTQDLSVLEHKISQLSPKQYHCLEDIIDSYLMALSDKNTET